MTPTFDLRTITRAVSDGTGRSPDEVWLFAAAASAVAVSVAAARVVLWAVDLALDLELLPRHPDSTPRDSLPPVS